jgi:pantetheine-phosphate adenylyltransferase
MKRIYELGLFMGRFQPFHKGHMYALRSAYSSCKKVVVGIGGAQERGTQRNPIDAKNRIRIIRAALRGSKMKPSRLKFLAVPDFNDNEKWFNYIIRAYPQIDAVFSRNVLVKSIFRGHGIVTVSPAWHDRKRLQATKIRSKIIRDIPWHDSVPKGAIRAIEENKEMIKGKGMRVVIGGTFAYLHRGHQHLIRKAFEIGDYVYIGLSTDRYSSVVKMRETVPRYPVRKKTLTSFVKRFGKKFSVMPLEDKFGPSTTGKFDAIVVTRDTLHTALQINSIRKSRGLSPLRIFKVEFILASDSRPISTTRIVNGEIDRHGNVL